MNSLSWMIYAADLTGSISGILTATSVGGAITATTCSIIWASTGDAPGYYSYDNREAKLAAHNAYRAQIAGFIKPALLVAIACATVATLIPSRGTMYAIAASETGERALNSQTGDKAIKALNSWLDRQIQADKPESSK